MTSADLTKFRTWAEELISLGADSPYPMALVSPSGRFLIGNKLFKDAGGKKTPSAGATIDEWLGSKAAAVRSKLFAGNAMATHGPIKLHGDMHTVVAEPIFGHNKEARLWLVALMPEGADLEQERLGYAGIRAGLERLSAGMDESEAVIILTDLHGGVIGLNSTARRTLATSANAVVGKSIEDFFKRTSGLVAALGASKDKVTEVRGQWAELGGRGRKTSVKGLAAGLCQGPEGDASFAIWLGYTMMVGERLADEAAAGMAAASSFVRDFFPTQDRAMTYRKGVILFQEGAPVDNLHILVDGQVRLFVDGGERARVIDVVHAGLLGAYDPHEMMPRHRYTAEVTKNSKVVSIPRDELVESSDSRLLERFLELVREQQMRLLQKVDILLQPSHRKRLARLLASYVDGGRCDDHGLMLPRISQVDLAEQIGATRKTVSDCLRDFTKEHVIRMGDRTIWVRDLQALRSL
jgi:CRP-like cAMP-binding protein